MTKIQRNEFIAAMSAQKIPAKDITPAMTGGAPAADIDKLAGSDHVFNTPEEYGALYDKLVAIENAQRTQGMKGDLDRASAVMKAYTPSTTPGATKSPAVDPSIRPRTTGIVPDKAKIDSSDAGHVRRFGKSHAEALRPAAEKNPFGPEASARNRILKETDRVETRVKELEAKMAKTPPGPERTKIEKQIDNEIVQFENTVVSDRMNASSAGSAGASKPTTPGSELNKSLPPFVKDTVDNGGVKIPGVPGAVKPSFSPKGLDWTLKF
jgi:hypothetical protein